MKNYNLPFISDVDLFSHVKETVNKYRFTIDLKKFNENIIDPIKLTFDSKVYNKTLHEVIESEILRQLDKTNNNHIGYFHQNIFKYFGKGWSNPEAVFDIINEEQKIYIEMKNKHNTMNSSSSKSTFIKMQAQLLKDPSSICMLAEVIATKSQNQKWVYNLEGTRISNENIRRISIDHLYELATGDKLAFKKLCEVLPKVINDVIESMQQRIGTNTVFAELEAISPNLLKSLYVLAFKKYQGFEDFEL